MHNQVVRDLAFSGNIYILTSGSTFSSACVFALTLKDNCAKTVGEPCGNASDKRPGFPVKFRVPNSGFTLAVSYKLWLRPDGSKPYEDAIMPDIPVYTTWQDIIESKDPQMDKIRELCK